ncbi:MAG: 4Fe-4S dicluster domain-containing protein [Deltaproteobacteria bacterium]|nr:MAG: 4Fe-4S dicluster domain-containing protein [Deltaproteobacteria bacterium]HDG96873.1 4Fe-4S dicluster domain-containing protein [Desulfobacterales bacterium]
MEQRHGNGPKYGMTIDLDKCTGCGTCMIACAAENNVTVWPDESDKQRNIAWMRLYRITNGKPFPNTEVSYFPRPCMQCEHNTPCVSVCPATATRMDPNTGIVSQIYTRCIGCRYCMAACPYHARNFNWYDGYFPKGKGLDEYLSPEVSPRMRGVVEKCTFCHHRLMRAKTKAYAEGRRELEEGEYITACAEACPAQAITFGDLNNPKHKVSQLAKSPRAFRLLERLGTEPKVYYLSSKEWIRKLADNYRPEELEPVGATKTG